jgi:hypothetical protein
LGGYVAVAPGDLDASELHARIRSEDASDTMPPPESNRTLSEAEKEILDRWIEQGAPFEGHWAFDPPQKSNPPTLANAAFATADASSPEKTKAWSQNPIDAFIANRLSETDLSPSDRAEPATLLRRASLTLTGLLPPRELQEKFLAQPTPEAYAAAVDELLRSMHFAERQSLRWLDAARYADTDGYQNDGERTNWPWRDWVTQAFFRNMPFDQFTIEQIAGDMLPDATNSQRLASAFNRNHRQNAEGGALADEFLVENVIDRVETTSTVWLGLTTGCARCHDHKYDPISQREFYQLFAYFNNIGEIGIGTGRNANPILETFSPLAEIDPVHLENLRLAEHELQVAQEAASRRQASWLDKLTNDLPIDNRVWAPANIQSATSTHGTLTSDDAGVLVGDPASAKASQYTVQLVPETKRVRSLRLIALPNPSLSGPLQLARSVNGNFVLTKLSARVDDAAVAIAGAVAEFEQPNYTAAGLLDNDPTTGWAVSGLPGSPTAVELTITFENEIELGDETPIELRMSFESSFAKHAIGQFQLLTTADPLPEITDQRLRSGKTLPANVVAAIRKPLRSKSDTTVISDYYQSIDDTLAIAKSNLAAAESELSSRNITRVNVMVMNERTGPPKPAFLLARGQYDQPQTDETLDRGVPVALLPKPPSTSSSETSSSENSSTINSSQNSGRFAQPTNRLDLARWLVSRENPLTARVIVNRIWQDHFGVGLVKTTEDFGLQGETPSHPKLLDYLAVQFMDSGWDTRAMHRLIVTSETYCQSSRMTAQQIEIDPDNRLLSHGPRYRADGFVIRDIALQSASLLNDQAGGPSVKPYQPTGLWAVVAANRGTRYAPSKGRDLFRKSMYTYWKRAVNPPRQTIFDAGGRETCNVRVRRTNTPLQALVLMNDPTFIEAARVLAQEVLVDDSIALADSIGEIYRRAIACPADPPTLDVLASNLQFFQQHFANNPSARDKFLAVGETPIATELDSATLAAHAAVAHLILNLDQFVTIE